MPGKGKGILLKGSPKKPVKRVSAAEAAALVARAKARRKEMDGPLECEKEMLRRRGR